MESVLGAAALVSAIRRGWVLVLVVVVVVVEEMMAVAAVQN